jgi:peptidoglycan-associated lipoprotein
MHHHTVPALLLKSVAPLLSAFMVVVAFSGCPGSEYPKCEKDDQCKKNKDGQTINEFCVFGQCQECAKDSQCAAGERCNKGRCDAQCTDDASCGVGQICEEGMCRTAECDASKPCAGGKACQSGRCLEPTSASGTCVEDLDCKGGMKCKAGICVASTITGQAVDCEQKTRVNFDFNVFDLRDDARAALDNYAKCMADHADWKVTIEGHCDDRGTTDYNLQLGERRAATIKEYLTRLGVDKARLKIISFGEERPLDPGQNEGAWAKNRRGELIVQ